VPRVPDRQLCMQSSRRGSCCGKHGSCCALSRSEALRGDGGVHGRVQRARRMGKRPGKVVSPPIA